MANEWRVFTPTPRDRAWGVLSTLWTDGGPQLSAVRVVAQGLDERGARARAESCQRAYDDIRRGMSADG